MSGLWLEITVDEGQAEEIRGLLAGVTEGVPRVLCRAINKVGTAARTQIVRRIVQEVNLKVTEVRNRNVLLRRANFYNLAAVLQISGRRIPLVKWGARQVRRGVSYAIRRGARKVAAGAFMEAGGRPIAMPSGHRGVFERGQPGTTRRVRKEGGRRGHYWSELPIHELYGPSVPVVVEGIEELSQEVMDRKITEDLAAEIDMQVGLVIARHGRGT